MSDEERFKEEEEPQDLFSQAKIEKSSSSNQLNQFKKGDFTLLITDLPSEVSLSEIKELFSKFGEVKSTSFPTPNIYGISEGFYNFYHI